MLETFVLDNPRASDGRMGSLTCDMCGNSTTKLLMIRIECKCRRETSAIICSGCLEKMSKKIYNAILK